MKELGGKYGFECRMCLAVGDLTLDHIIPLCILKHKANRLSNLQILCRDCHKRKTLWDYKIWNIKANLPIEKLSTVIL